MFTRLALLGSCCIALSAGTARAETTRPAAPGRAVEARPNALERANRDVLRQLRPSGLRAHARGFGALAERGCRDVGAKLGLRGVRSNPE